MQQNNQSVWIAPQQSQVPIQSQVQQTQPQMQQGAGSMSNLNSLFGGSVSPLQLLLGTGLLKQGKLSQAYTVLKPAKTTAQEQKLQIQKLQGQKMNRQLDDLMTQWSKIPAWQRLPIPGVGRIAPERASYETARDLFDYMLITMVADKRITDAERNYFRQQFPSLLMDKEVAKRKIEAIKGFVNDFSTIEPPSNTTPSVEDLLFLTQGGNE